jgi:hypothetical protein
MLKYLAPAIVVTALLLGATFVFAADPAPTTQTQTASAAATDATRPAPKVKKTKLHHVAKKTTKATNVSAKKKAAPATAPNDAASKPQTN